MKMPTDLSNLKPSDIKILNFTYTPELKEKMERQGLNIEKELRKVAEACVEAEAIKHGINPQSIKISIREVIE